MCNVKYFERRLSCRFVTTHLFGGFVCLRLKTGAQLEQPTMLEPLERANLVTEAN